MRAPIHSEKHYFQMSLFTISATLSVNQKLIDSVALLNKNQTFEVVEGAVVKAVFIELWLLGSSSGGSEVVCLCKDVQNLQGPTAAEMAALGNYNNKKNILFVHQGLSPNDGGDAPVLVMRGWYKIPKSKQRFGLGDALNLTILNPHATNDLFACGFCTYKEYT